MARSARCRPESACCTPVPCREAPLVRCSTSPASLHRRAAELPPRHGSRKGAHVGDHPGFRPVSVPSCRPVCSAMLPLPPPIAVTRATVDHVGRSVGSLPPRRQCPTCASRAAGTVCRRSSIHCAAVIELRGVRKTFNRWKGNLRVNDVRGAVPGRRWAGSRVGPGQTTLAQHVLGPAPTVTTRSCATVSNVPGRVVVPTTRCGRPNRSKNRLGATAASVRR